MMTEKFNEHYDTFDKILILMAIGDKTTQSAIHEYYNDYNKRSTISFDQFREKINDIWTDNFAKVIGYDVEKFIDKVLYHEDVPERCEELPIRISVGNRYLEIPMTPSTQRALEHALKQFSTTVIKIYGRGGIVWDD